VIFKRSGLRGGGGIKKFNGIVGKITRGGSDLDSRAGANRRKVMQSTLTWGVSMGDLPEKLTCGMPQGRAQKGRKDTHSTHGRISQKK